MNIQKFLILVLSLIFVTGIAEAKSTGRAAAAKYFQPLPKKQGVVAEGKQIKKSGKQNGKKVTKNKSKKRDVANVKKKSKSKKSKNK